MKNLRLILFISFIALHAKTFAQPAASGGTINFEQNGKHYTAKNISGTAVVGKDNNGILTLNFSVADKEREVSVKFYLRKLGELKPGTIALAKMDNKANPNFGLFANTPPGDADSNDHDAGAGTAKDVSADSEKGNFTISSVSTSGNQVVLSGSFEFSGKNSIAEGAEKNITVKGTFSKVSLVTFGPHLIKQ